jgi:site-specific DNA-adenine methylase
MCCYQGGKKRIAKKIYAAIREAEVGILGKKTCPWFEPFCGMGSVTNEVAKEEKDRKMFACDVLEDLILFWRAIQKDWVPPSTCNVERYNELKFSEASPERLFIGIVGSFNGNLFRNYRLDYSKKDFLGEARRGIEKVRKNMKKVQFLDACSYEKHEPCGMTIYCDPPYKGNQLGPVLFRDFDHEHFWEIMRRWSKNNLVFVSETLAPTDWISIWKHDSYVCNTQVKKKSMESLFLHQTWYEIYKNKKGI